MQTAPKQLNLEQFTGTEHYYKYLFGIKLTDGVKYLAEVAKCFWLLDIIASWQLEAKVKGQEFQVWKLQRCAEAWLVVCEDGNNNELCRQVVEYSDFEYESAEVWLINGVMLLPSEY